MVHILVSGKVQGIGFRQYTKYKAKKLNIRGWIKNLPDGRVEALFDGEPQSLRKMVEIAKKGPFSAEVKNVEVNWNVPKDPDIIDFQILK